MITPAVAGGSPSTEQAIALCQRIVRRRRYSLHPFVAELDRIQPDTEGLRRWAVQKYHQVFRQNVIFSSVHANAQEDEEVRRYAIGQLLAEETGIVSGDAPHYVLMRRFAEACGAVDADFDGRACSLPVRDYVQRLVTLCARPHLAVSLLVIFAIEAQSGEAAGRIGEWLAANRGFEAADLEWFAVHAADDDDHAADGMALVVRLAGDTPDFPRRAVEATEEITAAWLRLQDHYLRLLVRA